MIKIVLAGVLLLFLSVNEAKHQTPPVVDRGNSVLLQGKTVHGAVIYNDGSNDQRFHASTINSVSINYTQLNLARTTHVQNLISGMPFPVVKWPSVFARPCPHHAMGHKSTDRGTGLSHLQIWLEFMFFDNDLLEAVKRPKPEYLTSTSWSSNSGIFTSYENGSFVKNDIPFLEDDIIVIFEDSAYAVNSNETTLHTTIRHELLNMTTDLLFLGWCEHDSKHETKLHHNGTAAMRRAARSSAGAQSCMYAYALTRRGARALSRHLELCSALSLEEQVLNMVKYGWVSARRALDSSYSPVADSAADSMVSTTAGAHSESAVKCAGIFHRSNEMHF